MSTLRKTLVVMADILLFVTLILILQIDQMVNGTLYYYGLIFNNAWAQPYWLVFRISVVLIIVVILMISFVELPYPAFEEKADIERE
jgi:hypothetical protein